MKVLVTGGCGFIGSHLVEALRDRGDDVTGLAMYTSQDTYGWMDEIDGIRKVRGDVRDAEQMRSLVKGHELVFHLAALVSVPHSYDAPRSYLDTNVTGTLNVLMACREAGAKMVHTSTSEVYGTAQYTPIDERHPINPQSPYAASKVAADALVNAFRLSYDMPVVTLRPFNTYGPRQSERGVIASVIRQVLTSREITLGDVTPIRDWLYVADTARAFLAASRLDEGTYNAATGEARSVRDMLNLVVSTSERVGGLYFRLDETRLRPPQSEVRELLGSTDELRCATGWVPQVRFLDGIMETVAWWRSRTRPSLGIAA
jgi:nucleoside-diphosphate-sugar epimerase